MFENAVGSLLAKIAFDNEIQDIGWYDCGDLKLAEFIRSMSDDDTQGRMVSNFGVVKCAARLLANIKK